MGRGFFPLAVMVCLCWGCSTTPEEHRDLAYKKYSLDCVARGFTEDTEAHTRCVVEKYENFNKQQQTAHERMQELYAEPEPVADPTQTETNN